MLKNMSPAAIVIGVLTVFVNSWMKICKLPTVSVRFDKTSYIHIHHIYIDCWLPLYMWSVMDKQVASTPQYLKMGGGGHGYLYLHYCWPHVDWEPAINVDMVYTTFFQGQAWPLNI